MNNKENENNSKANSDPAKDEKNDTELEKLAEINKKETISKDELEDEIKYHEAQTERD